MFCCYGKCAWTAYNLVLSEVFITLTFSIYQRLNLDKINWASKCLLLSTVKLVIIVHYSIEILVIISWIFEEKIKCVFELSCKVFIIKLFCNLDFTFQKISSAPIKSWLATELLTWVEGWYLIHITISSKNILNGSGLIWPSSGKKWDSWYKISRNDHISILFNYDVRVKLVCFQLHIYHRVGQPKPYFGFNLSRNHT